MLHFPTALSYLAASSCPFLCCTTGFTSQADAISGIFALTLLARDRQGLGSRSGCSSLTMVMNPDSVCSSSLVLHRDSGWDCGTKARETQILGLSTAKRAQAHPADPLDLPRGVGPPVATSHGPARARGTLNTTKKPVTAQGGCHPSHSNHHSPPEPSWTPWSWRPQFYGLQLRPTDPPGTGLPRKVAGRHSLSIPGLYPLEKCQECCWQ